jgi:O-antigen ligase
VAAWATRVALLVSTGAALLVLLLYAPALEAPFLVPKFAALEVAAGLAALTFAVRRATAGGARWDRGVTLGALLVLGTTAASWFAASRTGAGAPYAVAALARWGALFGIAAGASVAVETEDGASQILEAITMAAGAVAALGLLQHVGLLPFPIPVFSLPGSTFGNRNLAAEVMAMSLPLGVALTLGARTRDARVLACIAMALEVAFLAATRARGAWFGAGAGLVAVAWMLRARASRGVLAFAASALVVAAVVASLPGHWSPHDAGDAKRYEGLSAVIEESVDLRSEALRTRVGLWRRTMKMTSDHAGFGVGPGNWPVVFPAYAEPYAARDGVLSATLAPRQAHDDLLERAAETGLPGVLALLLLAAAVASAVKRRLRTDDARARATVVGGAGALIALVGISVASFPLEMPGTLVLAGLALGLVATDTRRLAAAPDGRRAGPAVAVALVLVAWTVVRAERSIRASRDFAIAEHAGGRHHEARGATEAIAALNASLEAAPDAFAPRLALAHEELRAGHPLESVRAAEAALRVEPDSPNAWSALAEARLASNDARAATLAASEALHRLHDYPRALEVRARAEDQLAESAAAIRDRTELRALAAHAEDEETRRSARALLAPNAGD